MGDRLQMGKPSLYVTSHPGQLSLAIPPCVSAMSTSESWSMSGHTNRCTNPISLVLQCKLVSGWGLRKRRSVLALWLGKDFMLMLRTVYRKCTQIVLKFVVRLCRAEQATLCGKERCQTGPRDRRTAPWARWTGLVTTDTAGTPGQGLDTERACYGRLLIQLGLDRISFSASNLTLSAVLVVVSVSAGTGCLVLPYLRCLH